MAFKQQFDDFIVDYLDTARRITKIYVKNPGDIEDVVAESVEKALRSIHTLKNPDLMEGWFSKIIINTAIDHVRKESQSISMSEAHSIRHYDDFSRLEFESLLVMLPESDRQILLLRFADNRQLNEIADILGMNANTVKTRFYRSLKKLKLEVMDEGYRVNVKKENTAVKAVSALTLAILLSATLLFNLSPTLAAAVYDIPVLGNIVRVITFNRFAYSDGTYSAEILVPEIQGLLNQELQDRLNAEFREYADDLIRSFEATILDDAELGAEPARMSIRADYAVRTDNDAILSIDTWLSSDINGFVLHKFYTLDKSAGRQLALHDLFETGADYITPISAYLVTEMKRRNTEEGGVYFVEGSDYPGNHFTAIRPDHSFYISGEGELVICFDKHEAGAGFMGSPEFVIPSETIHDILASELIQY